MLGCFYIHPSFSFLLSVLGTKSRTLYMPGKYFGPSQIQIRHPPLDSCLLSLDFSGWAWDEDRKLKTSVHMVFKARGKSEIRQEDYGEGGGPSPGT